VPGQQQQQGVVTAAAAAGSARQQAVGLTGPGAVLAALPSSRSSSGTAIRGLGLSTGAHIAALGSAAVHAGWLGSGTPAAAAAVGGGLANRAGVGRPAEVGVDNISSGRQHVSGTSGVRGSSDSSSSSSRKAARERLRFLRQVVLMVLPGLQVCWGWAHQQVELLSFLRLQGMWSQRGAMLVFHNVLSRALAVMHASTSVCTSNAASSCHPSLVAMPDHANCIHLPCPS
jgi:hypothetical protein